MSAIRILHLFSNWKWTGPAEPAVLIAAEQARAGHRVGFACGRPVPGCENAVAREVRGRGIEPIEGLRLCKHRRILSNLRDSAPLTELLRERAPELVVVHQTNDHLLGATVVRRVRPGTPVVRVFYGGEMPPATRFNRRLFGRLTDGLVVFGDSLAEGFAERFRIAPERIRRSHPPVDLARFDPDHPPLARESFGFAQADVVVGIIARIQRHRRFELLFDAFGRALAEAPDLRLLIVGRGTHEESLARAPARAEPFRGKVALTGYRRGSDYVATLASLDAKVFLVPGTDGTCRAAREAMVMGYRSWRPAGGFCPSSSSTASRASWWTTTRKRSRPLSSASRSPTDTGSGWGIARASARRRFDPSVVAAAIGQVREETA